MTNFINDGRLPEEQPGQVWGADGMRFAASALHANQCAVERGDEPRVTDPIDLEPIPVKNMRAGALAVSAAYENVSPTVPLRDRLQALRDGFQDPSLPKRIAELSNQA